MVTLLAVAETSGIPAQWDESVLGLLGLGLILAIPVIIVGIVILRRADKSQTREPVRRGRSADTQPQEAPERESLSE